MQVVPLFGSVTETAGSYDFADGVADEDAGDALALDLAQGWDDASGWHNEDAAFSFLKKIKNAVNKVAHAVAPVAHIVSSVAHLPTSLAAKAAQAAANKVGIGGIYRSVASQVANLASPKIGGMLTSAVSRIASGQNLGRVLSGTARGVLSDLRAKARIAQIAASFVPGLGTGVAAALGAAGALAEGRSITDAVLASARAAIPGGPLAQLAFDTAVGAIKGQNVGAAALGAIRNQVPPGARAAFDAGLSLARGQSIQQAAIAAGGALLPPSPASASVLEFAKRAASGQRLDKAALSVAGQAAVSQLKKAVNQSAPGLGNMLRNTGDPLSNDDPLGDMDPLLAMDTRHDAGAPFRLRTAHLSPAVSRVAHALFNTPRLRALGPVQLARRLGVTNDAAREALASVAHSIARNSQMLTMPGPGQTISVGAMSLDRLLARRGKAAPGRFTAKSRFPYHNPAALARFRVAGGFDAGAPPDVGTIRQAQSDLVKLGAPGYKSGEIDGKIGPKTLAAITWFKAKYSAENSGPDDVVLGPIPTLDGPTITALAFKARGRPRPSQVIRAAQGDLLIVEQRANVTAPTGWDATDADGVAGPRTASAVGWFQKAWNARGSSSPKLPTTGSLDPITLSALALDARGIPGPPGMQTGLGTVLEPTPAPPPFTPPALPPAPTTPIDLGGGKVFIPLPGVPPIDLSKVPGMTPAPTPTTPVFTPPALPPGPITIPGLGTFDPSKVGNPAKDFGGGKGGDFGGGGSTVDLGIPPGTTIPSPWPTTPAAPPPAQKSSGGGGALAALAIAAALLG